MISRKEFKFTGIVDYTLDFLEREPEDELNKFTFPSFVSFEFFALAS